MINKNKKMSHCNEADLGLVIETRQSSGDGSLKLYIQSEAACFILKPQLLTTTEFLHLFLVLQWTDIIYGMGRRQGYTQTQQLLTSQQ